MTDRTPEQVNTALDRTETILVDLTIRLDRLEISLERLETKVEANTDAIAALTDRVDRIGAAMELLTDQGTRTDTAIDRLAGVFARYMDQATVERDYQRTVNQMVSDRLGQLEGSGE